MPRNTKAALRSAHIEERREKAMILRRSGVPYRTIAKQLGISEGQAFADVQFCLQQIRDRSIAVAEDHVTMELERLDMAMLGVSAKVQNGDLQALDRFLKIIEIRCALLGLNKPNTAAIVEAEASAPAAVRVDVSVDLAALDSMPYAELVRLHHEMLGELAETKRR